MVEIRDLRADELPFLRDMLHAALDWNPNRWLPPRLVLLRIPPVSMFHKRSGRTGDTALVADDDGDLLGLVWYRFFTDDEHGEGAVDEDTPELAIAVVDTHRSRGIGMQLMEAIHERARADGVTQISLSVDLDNPARRLYERLGYVELEPGDEDGRMVLRLA